MRTGSLEVHVVDDDVSVVRSLLRLLGAESLPAEGYASAESYLQDFRSERTGCVLLDLDLPRLSGLELQARLHDLDPDIPVVFLSGRGDISSSVRAMKAGASDFLTKPVDPAVLLQALREALLRRNEALTARQIHEHANERIALLTPRETEVLTAVSRGLLNKQIAMELGMAEKTVKVHRAHGLEKLRVHSVAELMRFAPILTIRCAERRHAI